MPGAVSMPIEEALVVLSRLLTMAEGCVNADELLTREECAAVATILSSVVSSKEDMTRALDAAREAKEKVDVWKGPKGRRL